MPCCADKGHRTSQRRDADLIPHLGETCLPDTRPGLEHLLSLGLCVFCRCSSMGRPSGSVVSPPSSTSPRYISTVATRFSPDSLLCTGSSNQSWNSRRQKQQRQQQQRTTSSSSSSSTGGQFLKLGLGARQPGHRLDGVCLDPLGCVLRPPPKQPSCCPTLCHTDPIGGPAGAAAPADTALPAKAQSGQAQCTQGSPLLVEAAKVLTQCASYFCPFW
jgi:hypothetical protein